MPPSKNLITSFLSTLIGQPHFGANRRPIPYVGGAAGHETNWKRYARFAGCNFLTPYGSSEVPLFS